MKELRRALIAVPAIALVVFLVAGYLTRGAMEHLSFLKRTGGRSAGNRLVDQSPWQTVEALTPLAISAEEHRLGREAERLADHEVDQAFAMALRQADLDKPALTGKALEVSQKVTTLQGMVNEDQARVDRLTAAAKAGKIPDDADDLDTAQAQLTLDKDELADANEELNRVSGDKRSQLQRELTARQAAMKKYDERANGEDGQIAVISAQRDPTLFGRMKRWFDQRSRLALLRQAQAQTNVDAASLKAQLAEIEKQKTAMTEKDATAAVGGRVARLAQMHEMVEVHEILEDRLQTTTELAGVYGSWVTQVELQHKIVTHLMLGSFAWIAFVVLCAALLAMGVRKLLERSTIERRTLHTLRTISALGIQLVALGIVLLIFFGLPSQIPTILGLATAGLTVVFQDFILAFFGWFVLMGKNGIRIGDWVEINGVGGEVVEIGLFRTALLETGNWTDKGHPTGRRVTFINNFAISGQYFNFSTLGQWMWDEITVNIPAGDDTYKTIELIHKAMLKETEKDAALAEQEWKGATRLQGLSHFSAMTTVDMRPAGSGIDIIVRYVTRAGERLDRRNRLYQTVIGLLHKRQDGTLVGAGSAALSEGNLKDH